MAALALAFPIRPGKTEEWKRAIADVTGPHRGETEDSHQRLGFTKVNWFLQQTQEGDIAIVYLEGDNPGRSYLLGLQSDHPYDYWFAQQFKSLFSFCFKQMPHKVPSEQVFEWQRS